jgi:hypothetical protein
MGHDRAVGCTRLSVLLLLLATAPFPAARAEEAPSSPPVAGLAKVTYVSGSSIYIDAGRERGLEKDQTLDLLRDGRVAMRLRIKDLSTTRSVCKLVDGDELPKVGDVVRIPGTDAAADSDSNPGLPPTSSEAESIDTAGMPGPARVSHVDQDRVIIESGENQGLRGGDKLRVVRGNSMVATLEVTGPGDVIPTPPVVKSTINGRVGIRYLMVQDRAIGGDHFSQPALDVRLDGNNLANGHFDVAVDIRSRRTYRTDAAVGTDTESQTRVYRLAASIHDLRGRFRLIAGRQFSPSLASVSTFDGVLASFNGAHVSTGLFAGTQPDPATFGRSDEVEEYGAFLQVHNRPGSQTQWSITTGGIGSYQNGIVNREYAYLQALLTSQRVSLYATQEIDYNRDWKVLAGEDQISPTSSYLHFGVRPTRSLNLRVGYDNRRNIRLYRDLITPETEFDDTFRRGFWGGFTQRIAKRFRVGLNVKRSTSETAGDADTYTMVFGATGLARRFNFFYRGSRYTNETTEGSLQSLTTDVSITRQLRMTMIGGLRQDTLIETPDMQTELVWYGIGCDVSLGRHWFLQLSGERTDGEQEKNDQVYLSTTYRF